MGLDGRKRREQEWGAQAAEHVPLRSVLQSPFPGLSRSLPGPPPCTQPYSSWHPHEHPQPMGGPWLALWLPGGLHPLPPPSLCLRLRMAVRTKIKLLQRCLWAPSPSALLALVPGTAHGAPPPCHPPSGEAVRQQWLAQGRKSLWGLRTCPGVIRSRLWIWPLSALGVLLARLLARLSAMPQAMDREVQEVSSLPWFPAPLSTESLGSVSSPSPWPFTPGCLSQLRNSPTSLQHAQSLPSLSVQPLWRPGVARTMSSCSAPSSVLLKPAMIPCQMCLCRSSVLPQKGSKGAARAGLWRLEIFSWFPALENQSFGNVLVGNDCERVSCKSKEPSSV